MITLIAAMNKKRTIGLKGKMPWHNPEDLKHFKNYTMGKTLFMGRKTYEGLPKKLKGRNIKVVSNTLDGGVKNFPNILKQGFDEEVIIAGGGEIYKLSLPYADKIVLSIIHDNDVLGDTFFPKIPSSFKLTEETIYDTFTLLTYERKE